MKMYPIRTELFKYLEDLGLSDDKISNIFCLVNKISKFEPDKSSVRSEGKITKYLRVTMPNGERWAVPILIIAESRATYYADRNAEREGLSKKDRDKRYKDELKYSLEDELEIYSWAPNNMNWSDVCEHAIKIGVEELDDRGYQEGWINGEKKIIDLNEDDEIV